MKTKSLSKVLMSFTLLMCSFAVNAQEWSDCVRWFKSSGEVLLAHMAHHQGIKSYEILQTRPSIIVIVHYDGDWIDFDCKFEVEQGKYDGVPYFKNVRVLDDGCWTEDTWAPARGYFNKYAKDYPPEFNRLYGESNYNELSKGKKVAAALMLEFLDSIY